MMMMKMLTMTMTMRGCRWCVGERIDEEEDDDGVGSSMPVIRPMVMAISGCIRKTCIKT